MKKGAARAAIISAAAVAKTAIASFFTVFPGKVFEPLGDAADKGARALNANQMYGSGNKKGRLRTGHASPHGWL
jgi:hypothetical protein